MRRRKVLALVGSIGASTLAGCSSEDSPAEQDGDNGGGSTGDDSSGDTSTDQSSGDGCIPETDSLADLFPEESEGFNLQRTVENGLDIGTDNYLVPIYTDPDGNRVAAIAARYETSSATENGAEAIRQASTDAVTGILVDGEIVVGFDAPSESTAQALLRASTVRDECASQLSFGGDDSSGDTSTDQSSGDGCIPETDSLADLFPEESEGFNLQQTGESGLDIGTDNYVVSIYRDPDGDGVAAVAAQYETSSATENGAEAIRQASTDAVTGILVDGEIVVGFDAPSESTAQALLRASAVRDECASQLSFSS